VTDQRNPLLRLWARMSPLGRAGAIVGVVVLLCCGGFSGLAVIGAAIDTPEIKQAADARPANEQPEPAAAVPSAAAATVAASAPPASPSETSATTAAPVVQKRTVQETQKIAFKTRKVKDSSLTEGTTETRVRGVAGVRTLTYEITVTDGVQSGKRLIKSVVTKKPVTKVTVIGTRSEPDCDPNYSGGCVPVDSDVDCAGGSGNGPSYVDGVVKVIGTDIYDLDRDNDGFGCD
jgi:hypothetical protein